MDSHHLETIVEPLTHARPPPQICLLNGNALSDAITGRWPCLEGVAQPKLENFLGGGGSVVMTERFSGNQSPTTAFQAGRPQYETDPKVVVCSGFGPQQLLRNRQVHDVDATGLVVESVKAIDTFGQRTSIYRGVTRHRWTGRYEAHLWDNTSRREGQSRKGRQVYLGGYDKEVKAARAYDLAALKYWGATTTINFPISNYANEIEEMKNMTRQEFVASLRRKSSGFSRGASIYRGVTRHHQHGRWQARIGRVAGNKDLYLGTFSTEEEAAEAYDIAAIKFRGPNAVTNFEMMRYDVKSIMNSNLPIGGISSKNNKVSESPCLRSIDVKTMDQDSIQSNTPSDFLMKTEQNCPPLSFGDVETQNITPAFLNPSAVGSPLTSNFSPEFQKNGHISIDNGIMFPTSAATNPGGAVDTVAAAAAARNLYYMYQQPSEFIRSDHQDSSGYATWTTPVVQTLQASRTNIDVVQTPLFGIE